jgi:hypothetical protein
MKKSDVNGDNTNEVYKWLKNEKAGLLGLTRIKVSSSNLKCPIPQALTYFNRLSFSGTSRSSW